MKIQVGSGRDIKEGFLNLNIFDLDIINYSDFLKYSEENCIECIFAEHVLEHISYDDLFTSCENIFKFLKPGGVFRCSIPDRFNKNEKYQKWVMPNGIGPSSDSHKVFLSYLDIKTLFCKHGQVIFYEYYDEDGNLFMYPYDIKYGTFKRSYRNEKRRKGMEYSSLIFDCLKPL